MGACRGEEYRAGKNVAKHLGPAARRRRVGSASNPAQSFGRVEHSLHLWPGGCPGHRLTVRGPRGGSADAARCTQRGPEVPTIRQPLAAAHVRGRRHEANARGQELGLVAKGATALLRGGRDGLADGHAVDTGPAADAPPGEGRGDHAVEGAAHESQTSRLVVAARPIPVRRQIGCVHAPVHGIGLEQRHRSRHARHGSPDASRQRGPDEGRTQRVLADKADEGQLVEEEATRRHLDGLQSSQKRSLLCCLREVKRADQS